MIENLNVKKCKLIDFDGGILRDRNWKNAFKKKNYLYVYKLKYLPKFIHSIISNSLFSDLDILIMNIYAIKKTIFEFLDPKFFRCFYPNNELLNTYIITSQDNSNLCNNVTSNNVITALNGEINKFLTFQTDIDFLDDLYLYDCNSNILVNDIETINLNNNTIARIEDGGKYIETRDIVNNTKNETNIIIDNIKPIINKFETNKEKYNLNEVINLDYEIIEDNFKAFK